MKNLTMTALALSFLSSVSTFALLTAQQRSVGMIGPDGKEKGRTGAEDDREKLLNADTNQLKVNLSLDRREYFPGEAASVVISISNPSGRTLEVFEPFRILTGAIDVQRKRLIGQEVRWESIASDPICCPNGRRGTIPTRLVGAGESVERKFRSFDRYVDSGDNDPPWPLVPMPMQLGDYRMRYNYAPSTSVEFSLVAARKEMVAYVGLSQPLRYFSKEQQKNVQLPREVTLAVLVGPDGLRNVVISSQAHVANRQASNDPRLPPGLSPFVRIGTTVLPIISLTGSAAPNEDISVSWSTSDGRVYSVRVDTDRNPK